METVSSSYSRSMAFVRRRAGKHIGDGAIVEMRIGCDWIISGLINIHGEVDWVEFVRDHRERTEVQRLRIHV